MGNGNIVFSPISNAPALVTGANNGVSLNAGNVVLGQDVGAIGNPAFMSNNREIPYLGNRYLQFQNLSNPTDGYIRIGTPFPGRTTILVRGNNFIVPGFAVQNDAGTVHKTWLIEAATLGDPDGYLAITDQIGLIVTIKRAQTTFSSQVTAFTTVRDSAVNLAIALPADRSRIVFTNRGAAGVITFSLPAFNGVSIWADYTFTIVAAFGIIIQAPAGVTIRIGGVVSPAGGTVSAGAVGDTVKLLQISATEWQAVSVVGAWATP